MGVHAMGGTEGRNAEAKWAHTQSMGGKGVQEAKMGARIGGDGFQIGSLYIHSRGSQ
jgi:hypothetical protein